MNKSTTLKVNGKIRHIEEGMTVREFLIREGVNPNVVACELNLSILRRHTLDRTPLKEGDELEIIQMIGGG